MDLKNSDIFSEFFDAAVEFASFPHTVRHLQAEATGIKTRSYSRERIATQLQGYADDPLRQDADRLRNVGAILSETFQQMGNCQIPLIFSPRRLVNGSTS